MTLDDREKLGPAETLLLEAADSRVAYHGSSADEVGAALLAQVREKLPDPERGTETLLGRVGEGEQGVMRNRRTAPTQSATEPPNGR